METNGTAFDPGDLMKVSVNVSDESRIARIEATFNHVDNRDLRADWTRRFDDPVANGTYAITDNWASDAPNGTWEVLFVVVEDEAGNAEEYYPHNNPDLHANITLGNGTGDVRPPVAHSVETNGTAFDPGDPMTVRVNVSDESGIAGISVSFNHVQNQDLSRHWGKRFDEPVGNGTYNITDSWDSDAPNGTWEVAHVFVWDEVENSEKYYPQNNPELHSNITLGNGTGDVSPPVPHSLETGRSAYEHGDTMDVALNVSDESGTDYIHVVFNHIDNPNLRREWTRQFDDPVGNGTYNVTDTWDSDAPTGVWEVHVVYLQDNVGNSEWYYPTDNPQIRANITLEAGPTPDLRVQNLTTDPDAPVEGEDVSVRGTIENAGDADATNFTVEFQVNSTAFGSVFVQRLAAGDTTQLESPERWTAQAGNHTARIRADSDGNVSEQDETNNVESLNVTVEQAPRPDLVIESITHEPDSPVEGETVTFEVVVANQGNASAENVTVAVDLDDERFAELHVGDLSSGEAVSTRTDGWESTHGYHDVTAEADPGHRVDESDEWNNARGRVFHVEPLPNLAVEGIEVTPSQPTTNDTLRFTVNVSNPGNDTAPNSTLAVEADSGNFSDALPVPQIEPNGTVLVTTTGWNPSQGDHGVVAEADAFHEVQETSETDNRGTLDFSVRPTNPDPTIRRFGWTPDPAMEDEEVRLETTIWNRGATTASDMSVHFTIDGKVIGTRVVALAPDETTTLRSPSWVAEDEGQYRVGVQAGADDPAIHGDQTSDLMRVLQGHTADASMGVGVGSPAGSMEAQTSLEAGCRLDLRGCTFYPTQEPTTASAGLFEDGLDAEGEARTPNDDADTRAEGDPSFPTIGFGEEHSVTRGVSVGVETWDGTASQYQDGGAVTVEVENPFEALP